MANCPNAVDSMVGEPERRADPALVRQFSTRCGFLLARVDQVCTSLFAEIGAGETLAQAELLMLIDALQPTPQIALAVAAGIDKSTTAYVLDNLEEAGAIVRSRDPRDARRVTVELTAAARARVPALHACYAELQDKLCEPLGPDGRAQLNAALMRIAADPGGAAPPWTAVEAGTLRLDAAPSFLCRRSQQQFHAQFVAAARGYGLTPRQFSFLYILARQSNLSQVEMARLYGVDPSTCAVILRNLTGRGLIAGFPSPHDGRARIFRATADGRKMLSEAQPIVDGTGQHVLRRFSPEERRALVDHLQAIVRHFAHRLRYPGDLLG